MPGSMPAPDTIVAVATPPGRGGVGIVRLSGPQSFPLIRALFAGTALPRPRSATYRLLRDEHGQRIDDALLTVFPAPHSYTGEDVVEIATHGSPVVQAWLLRACVEQGAVLARAGEFTERAFLNGRLDLTGAEAVRDLIEAQTLGQAQLAAQQIGGSIAAVIQPVKQSLVRLIATLEAGIDFAEDDLETVPQEELRRALHDVQVPLAALLGTFQHGRLLRDGLRLAIVGEPNVGKSSLFNRLLQHERAIVTATPGTTRDVIGERIQLDGIPVELLDTAGLRDTADEAERMGVARSRQTAADADAVLLVLDRSGPGGVAVPDDLRELLTGRPVIQVWNKIDLCGDATTRPAIAPATSSEHLDDPVPWPVVYTSAATGEGLPELKQAIITLARGGAEHGVGNGTIITNLRQQTAVQTAQDHMGKADRATAVSTPHEMVLLDLYEALRALDELTGETTPDDVLHLIFSTFCIGK